MAPQTTWSANSEPPLFPAGTPVPAQIPAGGLAAAVQASFLQSQKKRWAALSEEQREKVGTALSAYALARHRRMHLRIMSSTRRPSSSRALATLAGVAALVCLTAAAVMVFGAVERMPGRLAAALLAAVCLLLARSWLRARPARKPISALRG